MSLKSTGLKLQAEYADKRKRALNKRDEGKIDKVISVITELAKRGNVSLEALAKRSGSGKEGWEIAYDVIIRRLQASQLTINLSAEGWFSGENTYKTYATTYQKNVTDVGGAKVLKTQYKPDGTVSEEANFRLFADQKVTLPAEWENANRLKHPQRRKLFKAMSTGSNDWRTIDRVDIGNNKEGYQIDNRAFNPYAKQIFAALNYGKRASGSSINYGHSYIVLNPELKNKAIYFPGDTFSVSAAPNAVDRQCSFETLGAILAYCDSGMAQDIWTGCYLGQTCADTADAGALLEAHIFQEVQMNKHVESLYLSRRTKDGELSAVEWEVCLNNARKWARENNVRFQQ